MRNVNPYRFPASCRRERASEQLERHEGDGARPLFLGLHEEERRQLEADARSWRSRLGQFDRDLAQKPARIRAFYEVKAQRIEPLGLVCL